MDALMLIKACDQEASSPVNKPKGTSTNSSFKNLFASLSAPGEVHTEKAPVVEGAKFLSKVAPTPANEKEYNVAGDLFAVSIPLLIDYLESYTTQNSDQLSNDFRGDLSSLIGKLKEISTDSLSKNDFGSIISKYSKIDASHSGETISVISLSKGEQDVSLPELEPVQKLTLIKDIIDSFIDENSDLPQELTHALKTVSKIISQNVHFESMKESLPDVSAAFKTKEPKSEIDSKKHDQKNHVVDSGENHNVSWKDITVPFSAEQNVDSNNNIENDIDVVSEIKSAIGNTKATAQVLSSEDKVESEKNIRFFSDDNKVNNQSFSEGIVVRENSSNILETNQLHKSESLREFKYADLAQNQSVEGEKIELLASEANVDLSVKKNKVANHKEIFAVNKEESLFIEADSKKENVIAGIVKGKASDVKTAVLNRNVDVNSVKDTDVNLSVERKTSNEVNPLISKARVLRSDNVSLDQFAQKLSDIVKENNEPNREPDLKAEVSELNTFLRNEIRKSVKKVVMEHISQKKAQATQADKNLNPVINKQSHEVLGRPKDIQSGLFVNKPIHDQAQESSSINNEKVMDFSAELGKVFSPPEAVNSKDVSVADSETSVVETAKNSSLFKNVDIIKRNNIEPNVVSQIENKNFDSRINTVKEPVSIYKGQQQIIDQVKDALKIRLNLPDNEVRIRLNPKQLGEVSIKLSVVNDSSDASKQSVNVSFTVENENVKDALLSGVSTLKNSLEVNNGLDIKDFSVFVRDDGSFEGQNREHNNLHAAKKKKKFNINDLDEDVDDVDSISGERKVTGKFEYQA